MMLDLLALLAAFSGQADPNPVAPSHDGKLQCVVPDVAQHTCVTLTSYTPQGDNRYLAVMTQRIADEPVILMESRTVITIEGDGICSIFRRADYTAAYTFGDGRPLDARTAREVNAHFIRALAPYEGKRTCSHVSQAGDMWQAHATVDGEVVGGTQNFIWVDPSEGYKVGGRR